MDINITVIDTNSIGINANLIEVFSIVIILISALFYYFGVLWGGTQVKEYDKAACYIASTFFIIKYLLLPFALILVIEKYTSYFSNLSIFEPISDSFGFFILCFPTLVLQYIMLRRVRWNNKRFEERLKSRDKFEAFEYKQIDPCERLLLNFVPLIVIFIVYTFYILAVPFVIIFSSFSLAFLTFTNFAVYAGYREAGYPKAKIYLKDENTIEGNILKCGNYVYLLTDDEKCLINRDNISYIEEIEVKN